MGRYVTTNTSIINPGISDTKTPFGTGNYRIFSSSCTWTVPPGVGAVRATVLGAGGGAGGTWLAHEYMHWCQGSVGCAACYMGVRSYGAGGGGGGYAVGTYTVTPGCVCCVVVGAGGTNGSTTKYWCGCGLTGPTCTTPNTGCLSAPNGTVGGYSCAFGACAQGGGGGNGGKCGFNALCSFTCICTAMAAWGVLACQPPAPSGGTGGAGYGNSISYSGASGSSSGWCNGSITGYSMPQCPSIGWPCGCLCYRAQPDIYGGASGSPLGSACCWTVPTPFNGKAFDNTSCTEEYLKLAYDLPQPRWEGQIIYSQACGAGSNTQKTANSYQIWMGSNTNCIQSYCFQNSTCPANSYGSQSNFNTTLGGGGVPPALTLTYNYNSGSPIYYLQEFGGTNGAPGQVIVEW